MLSREDVQVLNAPFDARDHEFHRGFVYITESAITARIEQVDPSWQLIVNWLTNREDYVTAHVTLIIGDVRRDGIGMANQEYSTKITPPKPIGEPEKSATTDALKRAARLFGIGRYLLDAPKDLNESSLRKWLNGMRPAVPDAMPRGEPKRSELAAPAQPAAPAWDWQGTLTVVSRGEAKNGTTFYRFNSGVYTFSRDPFRAVGLTECETWKDLPLNETFDMPDGVVGYARKTGDERYELVQVEIEAVKS